MVGSLTACTIEPSQAESPPPGVINSPLVDNRWRLEEARFQGSSLTFDHVAPIYVIFRGGVSIYSDHCPGCGFRIAYLEDNKYFLFEGMCAGEQCGARILSTGVPPVDCTQLVGADADKEACAEAISQQFSRITSAFNATNEYELNEDALTLRGEEAEMRLVLDDP